MKTVEQPTNRRIFCSQADVLELAVQYIKEMKQEKSGKQTYPYGWFTD